MRGSREISLVPSLHRASTDALIIVVVTEYFHCVMSSISFLTVFKKEKWVPL